LFLNCGCGEENIPGYAANDCRIKLVGKREGYMNTFRILFMKNRLQLEECLHDYLLAVHFKVSDLRIEKADLKKMIAITKMIIREIITDGKKSEEE
jgi:hypothetical protein